MVILSKAKNLSEEKFLLGQDPTYNAVVLDFRVVDFLDSTLICCHPEFISESYYSQRSAKYYQNRFFGMIPSE